MTAQIINHPSLFDGDARLRRATRMMDLRLSSYMKEYNWEAELTQAYDEACKATELAARSVEAWSEVVKELAEDLGPQPAA